MIAGHRLDIQFFQHVALFSLIIVFAHLTLGASFFQVTSLQLAVFVFRRANRGPIIVATSSPNDRKYCFDISGAWPFH